MKYAFHKLAVVLAAGLSLQTMAQDPSNGGCTQSIPETPPAEIQTPTTGTPPSPVPQQQRVGDIRYITGGVGADSAEAMRRLRGDYPVAFTFGLRDGGRNQFLSGVFVRISRASGTPLLEIATEGPYLYVDLPPGDYHLTAGSNVGAVQEKDFTVRAARHSDMLILWSRQP